MCSCILGYHLLEDGVTCEDIDECKLGFCSHNCTNLSGSFECSCPIGWKLSMDSLNCTDIDECLANTHFCQQQCQNTVGSYQCSCDSGYQLLDDGYGCLECDSGNCTTEDPCELANCSQNCFRKGDVTKCACNEGFYLGDDGKSCEDIDECSEHDHDCSHECLNTDGSYRCKCPDEMTLQDDQLTCEAIIRYISFLKIKVTRLKFFNKMLIGVQVDFARRVARAWTWTSAPRRATIAHTVARIYKARIAALAPLAWILASATTSLALPPRIRASTQIARTSASKRLLVKWKI